jgi:hypothetical protein
VLTSIVKKGTFYYTPRLGKHSAAPSLGDGLQPSEKSFTNHQLRLMFIKDLLYILRDADKLFAWKMEAWIIVAFFFKWAGINKEGCYS